MSIACNYIKKSMQRDLSFNKMAKSRYENVSRMGRKRQLFPFEN